jgi:hypothetical protein
MVECSAKKYQADFKTGSPEWQHEVLGMKEDLILVLAEDEGELS